MSKKIKVVNLDEPQDETPVVKDSDDKTKTTSTDDQSKTEKDEQPSAVITAKPKSQKTSAKSKSFSNSFLVVGIVAIAVVVAILTSLTPNKPTLDEQFFTSDDTKSVISFSSDDSTASDHEMHVVYEYDGDKVISMKTYFEYKDTETAASAYESNKNQPEFKNSELKDNFIIVTADSSQFEGLTANDVRQQEEAIKEYQNSQKQKSEDSKKTDEDKKESDEDKKDSEESSN